MKIRTAAKAVIIRNQQILLIKNERSFIYYTLPGGGQNHNESLEEALVRECLEELGSHVEVKDICYVSEYIRDNHKTSIQPVGFHQVDIFFKCDLIGQVDLNRASQKDDSQVSFEWVDIDKLPEVTMYPMALRDIIKRDIKDIYLGEMT